MRILALDFDGVICDSADETARAGWLAGTVLWPEWAKHDIPPRYIREFRKLRPLLHTGFESIAILKIIEENYSLSFIKSNYHFLIRQIFTSTQYNFDELKGLMDKVRGDWIRINEKDWLSRHRFFSGFDSFIPAALEKYDAVYILTTKHGSFTKRLLDYAGITFDYENIIGLEKGMDKSESLRELADLYSESGSSEKRPEIIFLDDRYLTLEKIIKEPELSDVKLFMPAWGYNYPEERYAAEDEERITLLELDELDMLLE